MTEGGSIVCMTYYGAEKVIAGYNVMGVAKAALEASTRYLANDLGSRNIRVNAISAGPIQTLSARGVSDFSSMLKHAADHAPLAPQCRGPRSGQCRAFLMQPAGYRNYRRSDPRRLRLQHYGYLRVAQTSVCRFPACQPEQPD